MVMEVPVKNPYTNFICLNFYNFVLQFHNANLTSYKRLRSVKLLGPPQMMAMTTYKGFIVFAKSQGM